MKHQFKQIDYFQYDEGATTVSAQKPVWFLLEALLRQASDPEPEGIDDQHIAQSKKLSLGWLPLLTVVNAFGMLFIAYAFTSSRNGGDGLDTVFFPGLLLLFTPTFVRLILPATSRTERVGLLCVTGICLYFVKLMSSPLYFSLFDEFLHWRTADDIARSGHLFGENAMLPVSPYYPGLEIVTNAFSTISGLDSFHSGLVVVGVGRLLMVLALFGLNEQVLQSARMASIATVVYMVNPHFLIFDSLFAYESLALPLATFVIFAIAPHQWVSVRLAHLGSVAPFVIFAQTRRKGLSGDMRWITITGWIALVAVTFTHHVTDIFFVGLLLVWTVVYGFLRLTSMLRSMLTRTALLGILLTITLIGLQGNPVVGYVTSFLSNSFQELEHIVIGSGGARPLFVTYTGHPTPAWERVVMAFSVGVIVFSLPFGLLCLSQRYRTNALTCTLGIISLFYPISQVFRFTNSGAQFTDRAAAFLFIPIATVLTISITQFLPTRRMNWKNTSLLVCVLSIVFLGGILLGAGSGLSTLPGPYQVGADSRSLEPEGIQAALWARSQLGPNNRIGTDRINQLLMGTFGNQRIVTAIKDNIDISAVFFSARLGRDAVSLLKRGQVRYLVVDLRMAQALPLNGFYFVEGEPGSYQRTTPIRVDALTKFTITPQINRIFDSGDIVMYDAGGLIRASEKH
ncbi:MAG: hypothetical protein NVS4B1_28110 [Ktedonobacteraceae bacterium]